MGTQVETESTWCTFENVRDELFDLFVNVPFDPATGPSAEELEGEVRDYLAAHADQPRVLQKAHAFRIVLTRGRIYVNPGDWFAGRLDGADIVRRIRDEWYREVQRGELAEESGWFERMLGIGALRGLLDMGHISPGWENMFAGGLLGLVAEARARRDGLGSAITDEQRAFYEAVEIASTAAVTLSERFAALAEANADADPEHEARMRAVADACRRVPARAPRTFREALQFAWLMHELVELEGEWVRSMGHFDRLFYPYYRADLDAGRLTRDQARELIKFFWFKHHCRTRGRANGKNFVFGGQDRDGSDVTNDLTYLALEAYEELNTPDPKLSVRFCPGTPDALYRRVADLIRKGHNSFVLMNDVPAVEGLLKRGKALEDARVYLPIGCYEPAVDGKEAACTMNLVINLAKGVELALHDGVDPLSGEQVGPRTGDPLAFAGFEDLFAAYAAQMDFLVGRSIDYVGAHERRWPRVNPSPLIAATIDDCLARGRDIGQGGAHYNAVGCVGVGLADAADSLLALGQAVFEQERYTMAEVLGALSSDYEGREDMRQYLRHRCAKWGNDDAQADAMARRVADQFCGRVHSFTNARGGPCQAALFTLDFQWTMGRGTGALPDGRRSGTALAPGCGAAPGLDRAGVTALLKSVSKLDFTETPNGAVLDVALHPTAVSGDDGLDAMVALVKTFFARGGYAVQFNVFDAETLRDAQEHPERHASLQIRVTGWSVYFTTLSKYEQDQFIARSVHGL